ncbi:transcriptional regulator [Advenella kashmirensis W13003]|uniref:Transcriptional regulator n=1 Tax=Advenella kashmirensis W13003 TaxID=1424334 RepID=V8QS29_9BURK|nr:helix-turn-helix domain-containing protein [Advenella kashmirensis]ETF01799.1 transcriptional regulator [Advenella kashmirensis W13003]
MIKHQLLDKDSVRCNTCVLGHICVPQGLNVQDTARLNDLVKERVRIPKGTLFFKAGDRLTALYSIRSGSMKLQLENESGHMQITGFAFAGEIIGLDALAENAHISNAIAMEDTEVCVIRMSDLNFLSKEIPALAYRITRLMSQEISRSHNMVLSLGAMRSEQRLAAFLINLSQRFTCLGYSGSEYVLRMSREEIGNYLGLTLETVSRLLSRFAKEGLIRIHQREVQILDFNGLQTLIQNDPVHRVEFPKLTACN